MPKSQAFVRQTFHITLDIEATIQPNSEVTSDKRAEQYYQALAQALLAQPEILHQWLRSSAIAAIIPAKRLIEAEYNKGSVPPEVLLKPVMEGLEPEAQAYFAEEIEDQQNIYLLDGLKATVKRFQVTATPTQASPS